MHGILNFELYPWHSDAVTAPMVPPPAIIEKFVWRPCQETPLASAALTTVDAALRGEKARTTNVESNSSGFAQRGEVNSRG